MRYSTLFAFTLLLSFATVGLAASGELDRSFGTGQNGMTYFDTPFFVDALAVQADDRFYAGGSCGQAGAGNQFCITRFTANGAIDTTFGNGGAVVTTMTPVGGESSTVVRIIVQPDGKIIAAGYTDRQLPNLNHFYYIAVARYLQDGTLDNSFADQGRFFDLGNGNPQGMRLVDIALQPDGKLVAVAGWAQNGGAQVSTLRLDPDGMLDQTFGVGGRVLRTGPSEYVPGGVAVGPDGKVTVFSRGGDWIYRFDRYFANGAVDTSVGPEGRRDVDAGGESPIPQKVVVTPEGSTVALGYTHAITQVSKMFLTRLGSDLTFDPSFGNGGRLDTNLAGEQYCAAIDFQLRADGRITVPANCSISSATFSGPSYEVARFLPNGTLDTQYGKSGRVTVRGNRPFTGQSIIQSSGKMVICGRTTAQSGPAAGLFCERYLDNGSKESDLDADKKADISVFRPSSGTWYSNGSQSGFTATQFGASGDKIAPADFDGDGKVDHSVYRQGVWYQLLSRTNSFRAVTFGLSDDTPMAADYSGDGMADIAVFRGGDWYFLDSTTRQASFVHFGAPGDKPLVGNFDGDLKADPAVYRNGTWYLLNTTTGFSAAPFGLSDDMPVPADYDGDGATDLAVYRGGVWYILGSFTGFRAVSFGVPTDRPLAADFDGDGRADVAVYRNGIWYLQQSTAGFAAIGFGLADDVPIPAAFLN